MRAGSGVWASSLLGMLGLALAGLGSPAATQSPVPLKLTLTVAGRTQTLRGPGQCRHEPQASIYGTRALLWLAEYGEGASGAALRVSLTYWRPKSDGAVDEFQLRVTRGGKSHVISTVRGAPPAGSGRGSFRATALGGRFEIRGTAQDGTALEAIIECARFGGIVAEGG